MSNAASSLWEFSLAVYGEPGVAEACLVLQDDAGADVNVLLFLLWHAGAGRALAAVDAAAAEQAVAAWRDSVVVPLRGVRRWLKGSGDAQAEALRDEIKRLELAAERLEQQRLASLPAPGTPSDAPFPTRARDALGAYAERLGTLFPDAAVTRLVEASAARFVQPGG